MASLRLLGVLLEGEDHTCVTVLLLETGDNSLGLENLVLWLEILVEAQLVQLLVTCLVSLRFMCYHPLVIKHASVFVSDPSGVAPISDVVSLCVESVLISVLL